MSSVVIDDEPILYPEVSVPDTYVIMSREGFERYGAKAPKEAVMLIDSDMVEGRPECTFHEIPATSEARNTLGKVIVANIVMLGALVAATGIVSEAAIEKAVLDSVPKGTEKLNMSALKKGMELMSGKKG
jgi:2-oxoglutarate ferredoxin oxidoreductase subunit gamma